MWLFNFLNKGDEIYEHSNHELKIIKKLKNIYGSRYDYSKVRNIHSYDKIILVCPKHGDFSKTLHAHLLKTRCPNCFKQINFEKVMKYYKLL